MKPIPVFMIFGATLVVAPSADAQVQLGVGDMLRSLSGALRGKEESPQPQQKATPVLGVRGMDEAEQQAAAPASQDYVLMEGWTATRPEATGAAAARHLQAREAGYRQSGKAGGSQ
jgi:hypothetical protein